MCGSAAQLWNGEIMVEFQVGNRIVSFLYVWIFLLSTVEFASGSWHVGRGGREYLYVYEQVLY